MSTIDTHPTGANARTLASVRDGITNAIQDAIDRVLEIDQESTDSAKKREPVAIARDVLDYAVSVLGGPDDVRTFPAQVFLAAVKATKSGLPSTRSTAMDPAEFPRHVRTGLQLLHDLADWLTTQESGNLIDWEANRVLAISAQDQAIRVIEVPVEVDFTGIGGVSA